MGKNKISKVIDILCTSYNFEENQKITQDLRKFQETLNKPSKTLLKGEDIKDFSLTNPGINFKKRDNKNYLFKDKDMYFYEKTHINNKGPELEAFNSRCFRFLLNDKAILVETLIDKKENIRLGTVTKTSPDLESVYDMKQENGPLEFKIADIIAAQFCEEHKDFNSFELDVDENGTFYQYTFEQAAWPEAQKYSLFSSKQENEFPVTDYNISHFPTVKNTTHFNPIYTEEPFEFMQKAYRIFLKKALLTETDYMNAASLTISNKEFAKKCAHYKAERSLLFKNVLLSNLKFAIFFMTTKNLKEDIFKEFEMYNKNCDPKLNIEKLRENFEEFERVIVSQFEPMFEKLYQ